MRGIVRFFSNHTALLWVDIFLLISPISSIILHKLGRVRLVGEITGGDSYEYLLPFYYLLKQGIYWPDVRMPGYAVFYLIFLGLGFSPLVAQSMLILTNLGFTLLAIYISVNYIHRRTKGLYAHLMGVIWVTSPISYNWTAIYMDLPVAFLMVFLFIALMEKKYVWAGICLAVMIFSRPVTLPVLIVGVIYVWYQHDWASPLRRRDLSKALLAVLLPFSIAEGMWIGRNYLLYGDFRPAAGTHTMLHEPLYNGAAYYGYRIARALGYSSDSRVTFMLWGGWEVDTNIFLKLLPKEARDPELKALLVEVLMRTQKFRLEPTCDNEAYLNEKSAEALYKIRIPTHKRLLYMLFHVFFTDYAYIYGSLSPAKWIIHMPRHTRYFLSSFTFLLWLMLSTISVLFLKGVPTSRKENLTLLYLMPVSVLILHFILAVVHPYAHYPSMELRYLITYTPALGFIACLGIARCSREL